MFKLTIEFQKLHNKKNINLGLCVDTNKTLTSVSKAYPFLHLVYIRCIVSIHQTFAHYLRSSILSSDAVKVGSVSVT